jgi:hypothetical protein
MEIYTFNARSIVTWNVIKDYFSLDNIAMYREINSALESLKGILNDNDLNYSDFKNTLIPSQDKKDICFIFDSEKTVNTSSYGYEILDSIIPDIMKIEKVSVLYGDIIGGRKRESQLLIRQQLKENIPGYNPNEFHYSNQYFVVYLNNITEKIKNEIDLSQRKCRSYIGYIDMTFPCYLKNVLSVCIGVMFIKVKNSICVPTPEDDINNPKGYVHFNCSGLKYKFIGIEDTLFSTFLSYKLERSYFDFDNEDQFLSLNSVYKDPIVISDYKIEIDDRKLEYIRSEKKGSLKITGLNTLPKEQLIKLLQFNINTNYIFNMNFNEDFNCLKFATYIAISNGKIKRKYLTVFEINVQRKSLRLISLY